MGRAGRENSHRGLFLSVAFVPCCISCPAHPFVLFGRYDPVQIDDYTFPAYEKHVPSTSIYTVSRGGSPRMMSCCASAACKGVSSISRTVWRSPPLFLLVLSHSFGFSASVFHLRLRSVYLCACVRVCVRACQRDLVCV